MQQLQEAQVNLSQEDKDREAEANAGVGKSASVLQRLDVRALARPWGLEPGPAGGALSSATRSAHPAHVTPRPLAAPQMLDALMSDINRELDHFAGRKVRAAGPRLTAAPLKHRRAHGPTRLRRRPS